MRRKLRHLVSLLLGDFSWKPPLWLERPARRAAAWVRAHRRATVGIALVVLLIFTGGWTAYDWKRRQPKPVTVSVTAEPPGVTPVQKELKPQHLRIVFGESVARLDQLTTTKITVAGKVIEVPAAIAKSAPQLDPPLKGAWRWMSERVLDFEPAADWPADRKLRVKLARELLAPHVRLASYEIATKTAPFTATISKTDFYTDPTDPAVKQGVMTFDFTHAVDPAELEKRVSLAMIGGSEIFKPGAPRFTLTAGPHNRSAYLRTSALTLPEREDFLRITVAKGLPTTQGGAATLAEIEAKVRVPDLYSAFRIESAEGVIVRNSDGEPEQLILLKTTTPARSEDLLRALHIYALPPRPATDASDKKATPEPWSSAQEIDEDVLRDATLLPARLVPADKENSAVHSFRIKLEADGQLFVRVDKGVRALGGFLLGANYEDVLEVPELPREIAIQGSGGVLALNGERKLLVRSRGIREIEYEIARVPADQINHLVSQTCGEFQSPEFVNYRFGKENIARIATERQPLAVSSRFKANDSAFDFGKHLAPAADGGSPMQGLFFLKASERKEPKKKPETQDDAHSTEDENDGEDESEGEAVEDSRFILVTDLGIIVKENADGGRDVFVASIKTGAPLAGVSVELLAKNGVPMIRGETDADGHVAIASFGKPVREKRPIAFVARRGGDVAFMPYAREDRKLDFSRFDTGGVESKSGAELDAFVFTERGIYRPGDEIHAGIIVKQRDWRGRLEGVPIETEVIDARGTTVQVRKLALPEMGFAETSYQTAYESPSGAWQLNAYVVRDGKRGLLLGSASVQVKEFLPDRMKIESRLSKESAKGWVTPDGVSAAITLRNLYGTPATKRRIKTHAVLSPGGFSFEEFGDYAFFDRLRDVPEKDGGPKTQDIDLGEAETDDAGATKVELNLERFADATYALTFYAEGFEADGGRSVSTSNSLLVSALPFVIGSKSDGDLSYIPKDTKRAVEWIALNPERQKVAVEKLECRLIEQAYVSVLARNDEGSWVYESVLREKQIRSEDVSIPEAGLSYPLPTDVPGNFVLELRDAAGMRVSKVSFCVVGRGSVARSLEKNAELEVKLARPEYNTGDDIELSIVAPYTGSGLITIERDKVYAHAWFRADSTSSVQHIRVPEGFEGTGYVNVCFVRALDSREVFMSPLSYSAVPFRANLEKRRVPITLRAAEKTLPGEPLRIGFATDRPSRIAIFAVDQGILQVTNYDLPDPLSHFFRKCALMVGTSQIVDLILPEFSILRSAAAFGGDGEGRLNPFKRVTEKPVVFWSGVIDADAREREVIYDVPDYFSGTLTIMAVAVAPDGVNSVERESLVRGPFVITPNVPTVAAPGDVFEVSATIANGVEGSGAAAEVLASVEPSEHLELVKAPPQPLHIAEGTESSAAWTIRARDKFGSASLRFRAKTGGQASTVRSTLTVRPAVPFMTSVRGGNFTRDEVRIGVERTIHPDFRKLDATVSAVPLGLARGLDTFLKNYPNGCSEQISSGALCRLMLADEADFGLSKNEVRAQLDRTFAILRTRQNDHGSFGYWAPDNNDRIDFVSTYVMQLLIDAKAAGFAPPPGMVQSGLRHLQEMAIVEPGSLRDARIQAAAIYLLTREGVITTNYVLNLRDTLDRRFPKQWNSDLTTVYLAGACALLKKGDDAQRLIKGYKLGAHDSRETWDFHSQLGADAQYIAIISRHFPELLKRVTAAEFQSITSPISAGNFNTLSAAWAVVALKSYSQQLARVAPELSIREVSGQKRETPLRLDGSALFRRGSFSASAAALKFVAKNQPRGIGAFYQVVEAGYDAALPTAPIADGLEVFRETVDDAGAVLERARLGDPVSVRLRVRSLNGRDISNVALVDLLPGGFEVAAGSLQPGVGSAGCDYVEVREDRAVFFTSVSPRVREIRYQIKPTNRGSYVVPPVFAESMYDRTIKARGLATKLIVEDAK